MRTVAQTIMTAALTQPANWRHMAEFTGDPGTEHSRTAADCVLGP